MQDNPKVNRLGRRKAIIAWEFEHAKVDICVPSETKRPGDGQLPEGKHTFY